MSFFRFFTLRILLSNSRTLLGLAAGFWNDHQMANTSLLGSISQTTPQNANGFSEHSPLDPRIFQISMMRSDARKIFQKFRHQKMVKLLSRSSKAALGRQIFGLLQPYKPGLRIVFIKINLRSLTMTHGLYISDLKFKLLKV